MSEKQCIWIFDEAADSWDTSCEGKFSIFEGTPVDNGMLYCCYCGKPITIAQKT